METAAAPQVTAAATPTLAAPTPTQQTGTIATSNSAAFVQVASGEDHACALQQDGRVLCWGANGDGQLNVPPGMRFRQIASGYRFSCGIQTNGQIFCWGRNSHHQTEVPYGTFTALDAGWDHACALGRDGATCWGWDANGRATAPPGVLFKAIGAGAEHSCGLTVNGDLVCWGKNDSVDRPARGRADFLTGPFQALSVGVAHTCVLRYDGTPLCQGDNSAGQSDIPAKALTQISAGGDRTCGVLPDGSLECWGGSSGDERDVQPDAPPGHFRSVSTGWKSPCGVTVNGHAQCWGFEYDIRSLRADDQSTTSDAGSDQPSRTADTVYNRLRFVDAFPDVKPGWTTDLFLFPAGGFGVVDKSGLITTYVSGSDPQVLIDLTDITGTGFEQGMLSAAVDPNFGEYPFIYVYYTVQGDSEKGEATAGQLSRFPIVDGRAIRDDELVILKVDRSHEANFHYGGAIRFASDGTLYLGIGDGECFECPQRLDSLLGKIIRIDVRGATAQHPYRIPLDNPFVGTPNARPEVWAYGLRNPWRMAFDSKSEELWVGDVGHHTSEEVSIATAGANLGWPVYEGATCLADEGFMFLASHYDAKAPLACSEFEDLTAPVIAYKRADEDFMDTCAVVGGLVYRGASIPWLDGVYLFGDYCSGEIWALGSHQDTGWRLIEIAELPFSFSSFATDASGEVYVLQLWGPILRLVDTKWHALFLDAIQTESGSVPWLTIVPSDTSVQDTPASA